MKRVVPLVEAARDARKRPRILILAQLPPPVHGASVVNQMVATSRRLRSAFAVSVLPIRMTGDLANLRAFRVGKVVRSLSLYASTTRRLISTFRPDLVYFTLSPGGFALLRDSVVVALLRLFSVPHIFHLHGRGIAQNAQLLPWRVLYKFLFAKAHVIALSERLSEDVSDFVPRERISVVPNGIPDLLEDRDVARLIFTRAAKSEPTILFLSNMHPSKGPLLLLEALSLLNNAGYSFSAVFAGAWRGFITPALFASRTWELGLAERVSHVGPAYGEEKGRLFREADLFVLPTTYKHEAFPLVVLEAQSYALPVVTTDIGALPEIIQEGENGFTVRPGELNALVERLALLLSDGKLREKMSWAARTRFKALYDVEQFEQRLSEVLDTVVRSPSAHR